MIHKCIKGLVGPFQLDIAKMDFLGTSFQCIIEHAKLTMSITQAT